MPRGCDSVGCSQGTGFLKAPPEDSNVKAGSKEQGQRKSANGGAPQGSQVGLNSDLGAGHANRETQRGLISELRGSLCMSLRLSFLICKMEICPLGPRAD